MPITDSHPFACTECGRCFTRRSDLNRHTLRHKPDAKRYYCAYPGCAHSSLQKGNLKTHYIAKHLLQRLFHCRFEGCPKSYSDDSALVKHEKSHHGFFRREKGLHERQMLPSVRLGLPPSVFIKGYSEQRIPSPTPSLCYSISDNSTRYSQSLSPAPAMAPATNGVVHNLNSEIPVVPLSTDEFLHEMIPELFPKPTQTVASDIHSVPPIPSSNAWNADFTSLLQEPYPKPTQTVSSNTPFVPPIPSSNAWNADFASLLQEPYPEPTQTVSSNIPSVPPIPSSNAWNADFTSLLQEPYPKPTQTVASNIPSVPPIPSTNTRNADFTSLLQEPYPKPTQTVTSDIPSVPPIPSSNAWNADFASLFQEPYPTHSGYGKESLDPNVFTLFDLSNLTFPSETTFRPFL